MRSRKRTDYTPDDHIVLEYGPSRIPLQYTSPSYTRYEEILEGAAVRSGKRWLREVQHSVHDSALMNAVDYKATDKVSQVYVKRYLPPLTPTLLYQKTPYPSSALIKSEALAAFNSFNEQLPAEVGIVNFLWELRELGTLLPRLEKSLAKTVAGGYLNLEFGWKPLLGDLAKLSQITTAIDSRLSYLRDTWGKRTRVGYQRRDFYTPAEPVDSEFYSYDTSPWILRRATYGCDFRATGYLYHKLEGLDDMWTTTRGFIGALGLNNPLLTVWNGLPYSFVADWIGNFSGQFRRFAVQPFVGEWSISDAMWSTSEVAMFRVIQNFHLGGNPQVDRGWIRVRRYVRRIGLPIEWSLENIGSLTERQQTLLLALTEARQKH